MQNILVIVVLVILAFFGYKYFQSEEIIADTPVATATVTANDLDGIRPTYNESVVESSAPTIAPVIKTKIVIAKTATAKTVSYRCDGRQHCSQMRSCAEATYFSNNCPNTKMDGNNDGVPCEQQWCH